MRYFVVTHQEVPWALPAAMEPISSVPVGEGVTDLCSDFPQYAGRGPELSEYATLFGLARRFQEEWATSGSPAEDEMVGIGHYRRFVVTRPTGGTWGIYRVVHPERFVRLRPDLFLPRPGRLLAPEPMGVGQVLAHYGNIHVLRDLLFVMGLAVDLGVVTGRAVSTFLTGDTMTPAPTVGVYPLRWYVETMTKLDAVARAFEATAAVEHEGYQRRALGFSLERLHGLLLAELVATWDKDKVWRQPMILVSDDGNYTVGG